MLPGMLISDGYKKSPRIAEASNFTKSEINSQSHRILL